MTFFRKLRKQSWILGYALLLSWLSFGFYGSQIWAVAPSVMEPIAPGEMPDLIRLHVLANSDDPNDQALKYQVRDAIVAELTEPLQASGSLDESRQIVQENLPKLEAAAGQIISEAGYDYPVQALLGEYSFPTRSYGDWVLPAGQYEAVRVVIGQGAGANWWCVLFPPLCFINGATEEVSAPANTQAAENPLAVAAVPSNDLGVQMAQPELLPEIQLEADYSTAEPITENHPQIRWRCLDWYKEIFES